jgi:hypothetical protein
LLVEATQTYELPSVFPENANLLEDVNTLAPDAGYLLTTAFPHRTLEQADEILTITEGPGGAAFGVYSRLDLYRAAEELLQCPRELLFTERTKLSTRCLF